MGSQGSAGVRRGGLGKTVRQIVPRAAGGWAARRSAQHASTVPTATLRLEPACASLASSAAAARMCAQQAGLVPAARQGALVPMMGTATQPPDTAAVPLGGPALAVREPVIVVTGDLTAATSATAALATGAVMPSVACVCVRLATWARSASSGVPRATSGPAVSSGASVSTEQPVTMSVGPALARQAGGAPSASVPARPASLDWTVAMLATALPEPPAML